MHIEIMNVYETYRDDAKGKYTGTMHIKIALPNNVVVHLKGIFVKRNKDTWFFAMPTKTAKEPCTGLTVKYGLVYFEDKLISDQIHAYLKNQGSLYMQAFLRNNKPSTSIPEGKSIRFKLYKPFN